MTLGEFQLIDRFFRNCGAGRNDVALGIGDDAALLKTQPGWLVAAVDTLVEGIHFPAGTEAESIGHRALAVNLSDLAAMGATPAWTLLALTLPRADSLWLEGFAAGFARLAREHDVALVGGDTTSGPCTVTVTALGWVSPERALRRSGARAGDALWVSGSPGDAAYGLRLEAHRPPAAPLTAAQRTLLARFRFPTPRVALGRALGGVASACIDVSDGLAADAGKLAAASGCGVEIDLDRLPVSAALRQVAGLDEARQIALTGGDDYELCFSAPDSDCSTFEGCTRIGRLSVEKGVRVHASGRPVDIPVSGYEHFGGR